jgi:hypothetical protein
LVLLKYYGFVKKNFYRAITGGGTSVPRSLRLRRSRKNLKIGQRFLPGQVYEFSTGAENNVKNPLLTLVQNWPLQGNRSRAPIFLENFQISKVRKVVLEMLQL